MQPTTVRRINVGWIRSDSDNPPQTKVHKLIHTSIYWIHCSLNEHIPVLWIPAQICLEQICIYPKGVRQDSLT